MSDFEHRGSPRPPTPSPQGEGERVALRPATLDDIPHFERWDRDPAVIAAANDDPTAAVAFGADWADELEMQSDVFRYYVAELDGAPIGAMLSIDPREEPTHYWGEIEPHLRALDIWIGEPTARGRGIGAAMMRQMIDLCFADPKITAIVIDPLNTNTDAHRFYRRLGFQPVGRQMFGDDDCLVHRLERADWRKG